MKERAMIEAKVDICVTLERKKMKSTGHRLRGVGAVLVEQPAVLAGQHLVALARAEQRVVQPGVHQHKLIAERRVIDQKVFKIARQLPQRALQHLRQAASTPLPRPRARTRSP